MKGFCECGCGQKTELATYTSKPRGWVKGEPKRFIRWHHSKVQFLNKPEAYDRIMSRAKRCENGCLDAGPSTGRDWYGLVSRDGKMVHSHKVVWEKLHGPVPEGRVIRHTCDNMRCVEDAHLMLGTQADNIADAVQRGRMQKGEDRHNAKLSEDDVRAIRSSPKEGKILASEFKVSAATISVIRRFLTWKHVT